MKYWSYGINSIHKTASIYLEEAPWWILMLDKSIDYICYLIPAIPLPSIKIKLKDKEEFELNEEDEWTTLKDWYKDLNVFSHCKVHIPLFYFCQKRIKIKSIDIDYDKAKELFYEEDRKFWDEEMSI